MFFYPKFVSHGILCIAIVSSQFVSFVHRHQVKTLVSPNQPGADRKLDLFSLLEEYRAEQQLSPTDLEYWQDVFEGDVSKMASFVREKTGLVPYRGSLRGSRGVLLDRRGNALDRAILLAEWLRLGGKNVRLCNKELTPKQAARLIPQINAFDSRELLDSQFKAVEHRQIAFARLAKDKAGAASPSTKDQQTEQLLSDSVARAESQFGELSRIVGNFDGPNSNSDQCLNALRDHWWVAFQRGDEWVELDPTNLQSEFQLVADQVVQVDPAKRTELSLELNLQHRIEYRIVIEQWTESNYRQHVALKAEVIASQVFDQPTMIYHIPRKWPQGIPLPQNTSELAKLQGSIETQKEWVPVLAIGDQPVIQKAFDDQGYLLEEATPSAFGQMGLGLSRGSQAPGILTAEWIEYEIRVPGQDNRIEKREIFDWVGENSRQSRTAPRWTKELNSQRQMALTDSVEILPLVCNLDSQIAERVFLECLVVNQEIFGGFDSGQPRNASSVREQLVGLAPMPAMVWALGVLRSEQLNQNERIFIGSPNLVTFHRRFKKIDGQRLKICAGMDIVFNQIHVLPGEKEQAIRMQVGILDTNLEALMLEDCSKVDNTAELFHESVKQGVSWKLVDTEETLKQIKCSDSIKAKMLNSLRMGFAIVAPEQPVSYNNQQEVAWWRVNKTTGETLGIGPRGWGQASTEYSVLMNSTSKRGEGLVEYLIIISLIAVCFIVTLVKWVASPFTHVVKDKFDDWEFCVSTEEQEKEYPPPADLDGTDDRDKR